MSVCCVCCVLSASGLCDGPITRPEESYRVVRRCVWSRNLVTEGALAHLGGGLLHQNKKNKERPKVVKYVSVITIQNYQRDALNIIYSYNIITLLYIFRVSSTHLQEDTVVHKQHMVPSLSIRVLVSCW